MTDENKPKGIRALITNCKKGELRTMSDIMAVLPDFTVVLTVFNCHFPTIFCPFFISLPFLILAIIKAIQKYDKQFILPH